MSKIFDAYRKQLGDVSDLVVEVGKAGSISLFPSPEGRQRDDFHRLANRLLDLRVGRTGSVLSVASSARQEGASYVSYNVAVYLATMFSQKVAWLDVNFLSPQGRLMGLEADDLGHLLQDPGRALEMTVAGNPHLIACGDGLKSAKGLLAGPRFGELLQVLRGRFDFVFLDLPPVLESPDTPLIAANTDGLLLVIEQKFLKREVIGHGLETLREKGVTLVGSVINRRSFELPKVIYERL